MLEEEVTSGRWDDDESREVYEEVQNKVGDGKDVWSMF